jgi:flagellar biosynthesis protein FliP
MVSTDSALTVLVTLLLFTSFIKIVTALTVFRYGVGLTGFEFGVVCLLAAFGLAVVAAPPELAQVGFPQAFFSNQPTPKTEEVTKALVPFMSKRVDPAVGRALDSARDVQRDAQDSPQELRTIAPAFILSELKQALSIGCLLLIPFIAIDLVVAHLMALVGISHLATSVVSLPLKLLLFLAVDGWTLLAKKLLDL